MGEARAEYQQWVTQAAERHVASRRVHRRGHRGFGGGGGGGGDLAPPSRGESEKGSGLQPDGRTELVLRVVQRGVFSLTRGRLGGTVTVQVSGKAHGSKLVVGELQPESMWVAKSPRHQEDIGAVEPEPFTPVPQQRPTQPRTQRAWRGEVAQQQRARQQRASVDDSASSQTPNHSAADEPFEL